MISIVDLMLDLKVLKENEEFMRAWVTAKYGKVQEELICKYNGKFSIKPRQDKNSYNNTIFGDLFYEGHYIDLKVATSDTFTGAISKGSVENFTDTGYYLCLNRTFSKFCLVPRSDLKQLLDNKFLDYKDDKYVASMDYKKYFTEYTI